MMRAGRAYAIVGSILASLFCLAAAPPALASPPGTEIAQVPAVGAGPGVSVAFDGVYLYYTDTNGVRLERIKPDGTGHAETPIVGAPGINAFTYDATRDVFWAAGSDGGTIYRLEKSGVATPKMNVAPALASHGDCDTEQLGGCQPLVDGIAYDGTDDTLWYSPDSSSRVYHFDISDANVAVDATLIGFFDVNDPGRDASGQPLASTDANADNMAPQCGEDLNSGIGAGAQYLFLTNGDCIPNPPTSKAYYFQYAKTNYNPPNPPCYDKTGLDAFGNVTVFSGADPLLAKDCPGTKIAYYPYNAPRAEDLECDDVTFPDNVMWIRDYVDNNMRAFALPTGTCIYGGGVRVALNQSRVTGGGFLATTMPPLDRAYHGFMLHCNTMTQPDRLQISWGNGERFHMTALTGVNCTDDALTPNPPGTTFDTIEGDGTGRYDGKNGAHVHFKFKDAGEPGTADSGSLTVTMGGIPVLQADGLLLGGNYQTHQG
jgi:hypothetical protein